MPRRARLLALTVALGGCHAEHADLPRVWIDEVMVRNDSTWMDQGELPDWVEIVNGSEAEVDVERLSLDGLGGAFAPEGPPLAPGERRVWGFSPVGGFHLADAGDRLTLSVDGVPVDRVATGRLPGDVALARTPSGGAWAPTTWATPGNPNRTAPSPTLDPSDALYLAERPIDVSLSLDADAWAALERSPYDEVPGTLAFEGVRFDPIHLRIKGQWGSLRTLDQKAAWRVDVDDHRLRGQEHLTLNNAVQDPTFLREALAYEVFRRAGAPAPRVGWARVDVRGEPFGLYVVLETLDEDFLARRYADPDGPLFEGAYGVDLVPGQDAAFEIDRGDPEDLVYVAEISDALAAYPDEAALVRVERLIDLDEWLTVLAVEIATGHWDGYYTRNNYRIYRDPVDGRFDLLPWGTDQTWQYPLDPFGGQGVVLGFCLQVPSCRGRYVDRLHAVADVLDSEDWDAWIDARDAWIAPLAAVDPRREFDDGGRAWSLDVLRAEVAASAQRLREVTP